MRILFLHISALWDGEFLKAVNWIAGMQSQYQDRLTESCVGEKYGLL
jgi:hypothetical protein